MSPATRGNAAWPVGGHTGQTGSAPLSGQVLPARAGAATLTCDGWAVTASLALHGPAPRPIWTHAGNGGPAARFYGAPRRALAPPGSPRDRVAFPVLFRCLAPNLDQVRGCVQLRRDAIRHVPQRIAQRRSLHVHDLVTRPCAPVAHDHSESGHSMTPVGLS